MERSYDYLYFPYINFRSDRWLKIVALYGNSVARIVPRGYPTRHSETVDTLVAERFIQDIRPTAAGVRPAATFSAFVIENQEALRPTFAVDLEAN